MNSGASTLSQSNVILASILELFGVAALVFGIGWGSARLAEAVHGLPVRPDRTGVITLRIAKSDRQGNVAFEEGTGYAGWWHCQGEWKVDWRLAPRAIGRYRVFARACSLGQNSHDRIQLQIGDQQLIGSVPNTGDPSKWKDIDCGVVSMDARPYTLTVQPLASNSPEGVNVKSVFLRPELAEPK